MSAADNFIQALNDVSEFLGAVRRVGGGGTALDPEVVAQLLARSVTYAFASFGVAGHGGASAALNAKPEARAEAITAFLDEVRPRAGWPGRVRAS